METVKLGSHFVIISHQFTSSMDALRGRLWLLWPAAIWCQSSCIFLIASVSSLLSGVHRFLFERGPLHSLPMSKKLQIQNKINLINLNLPVLCTKTILHDTPPFINWPYWANGGKWQELIRRRCSCSFFDGWITQTNYYSNYEKNNNSNSHPIWSKVILGFDCDYILNLDEISLTPRTNGQKVSIHTRSYKWDKPDFLCYPKFHSGLPLKLPCQGKSDQEKRNISDYWESCIVAPRENICLMQFREPFLNLFNCIVSLLNFLHRTDNLHQCKEHKIRNDHG